MLDVTQTPTLPNAPGVGYKSQHFTGPHRDPGPVRWIEVHAENYMGDGGRPLAQLRALSERFPVSSTASACPSAGSARSTAIMCAACAA
jgi:uncharacterized protein (UPF0276 family)